MGIVEVKELPKRRSSGRKSKYPFSAEEVKQAAKQLKDAGSVGCGPYPTDGKPLRAARSAAQRLKNLMVEQENVDASIIKTTAWEDDKGEWGALVDKSQNP